LPQVEDYGKKEDEGHRTGCNQHLGMNTLPGNRIAVTAEKPDDLAPTTHKIPQIPKKSCQLPMSASS
jgi:hypothetical protein